MAKDTDEIKAALRAERAPPKPIPMADFLDTGITLLNLALTGKPNCGYSKGKYFWIVGDSSSGKSFFLMTVLAEAARNRNFDNYDFYHDNNEDGVLMDVAKYFGEGVASRLRAPKYGEDMEPLPSRTAEQFYYNLDDATKYAKKKKRSFIYELDSENGLDADASREKFEEQKEAEAAGNQKKGSYGDGKAKIHSQNIRRVVADLKDTGAIALIVSQTRDNIGFGFDPKTVSGGRALKFYATAEIWTSVKQSIYRNVRGEKLKVGVLIEIRIKKNRYTGKERTVFVPIYYATGFDDVGSCVQYLIDRKHWKPSTKVKGAYSCPEFEFRGDEEEIIHHVEENNLTKDLREIVAEVWSQVEEEAEVKRKPKYA